MTTDSIDEIVKKLNSLELEKIVCAMIIDEVIETLYKEYKENELE
jgi:hypothetical protein